MHVSNRRIDFFDDDVQWRVESYLGRQHFPGIRGLEVQVDDGVVTVTGQVDNFHQRQVAVNACRRVAGVLKLVDEIQVLTPAIS